VHIRLHDVDGQTLRVGVRHGDKASPPLLLFNGIGANIELVEPFLNELKSPEVITFDVPGVGGSPAPKFPYRPSTLSRFGSSISSGTNRWTCSACPGEGRWRNNSPSSSRPAAGGSC